MVNAEKGFAFVITHKGRVFMGLNAQMQVRGDGCCCCCCCGGGGGGGMVTMMMMIMMMMMMLMMVMMVMCFTQVKKGSVVEFSVAQGDKV